jgi:uncharacterized membrane protein
MQTPPAQPPLSSKATLISIVGLITLGVVVVVVSSLARVPLAALSALLAFITQVIVLLVAYLVSILHVTVTQVNGQVQALVQTQRQQLSNATRIPATNTEQAANSTTAETGIP